jgi:hypothetical protein
MGQYYETFYPPFFMARRYAYDAIAVNPKGYERDAAEIVTDLRRRFVEIEPIDTSMVDVSCEDEIVSLRGQVASDAVAQFLGRVAQNILGVRSVLNLLVVTRAGASAQSSETRRDVSVAELVPSKPSVADVEPSTH